MLMLNQDYFREGCRARGDNQPRTNPYPPTSSGWMWWDLGYEHVDRLDRAVKAERSLAQLRVDQGKRTGAR
jgi:hypothetical protein